MVAVAVIKIKQNKTKTMLSMMICDAVGLCNGDCAYVYCRKIIELEEELKVVSNNMKSLEIAEQEARMTLTSLLLHVRVNI